MIHIDCLSYQKDGCPQEGEGKAEIPEKERAEDRNRKYRYGGSLMEI